MARNIKIIIATNIMIVMAFRADSHNRWRCLGDIAAAVSASKPDAPQIPTLRSHDPLAPVGGR
jgi:hypothetical protein